MGSARHDVVLSSQEQEVLAALEAAASGDDPALDRRLCAGRGVRWRPSSRTLSAAAALCLTVGSLLMLFTLTRSIWVAGAGAALQGMGLWASIEMVGRRSHEPHQT